MWSCTSEERHPSMSEVCCDVAVCGVFVLGRVGRQQINIHGNALFRGESRAPSHRTRFPRARVKLAEVAAHGPLFTHLPRLLGCGPRTFDERNGLYDFSIWLCDDERTTPTTFDTTRSLIKYRHNGSQGQQPHLEEPYDHAIPLLERHIESQQNLTLFLQTSARIGSVASACTSTR